MTDSWDAIGDLTAGPRACDPVVTAGGALFPPVTFTAPMPPSVNAAYRHDKKSGRRVATKAYRDWISHAKWEVAAQKPNSTKGRVVTLFGFERLHKTADLNNRVKLIEDLLTKMDLIEDDRFVTASFHVWLPNKSGQCHVSIYPAQQLDIRFVPVDSGDVGGLIVDLDQDTGTPYGDQLKRLEARDGK